MVFVYEMKWRKIKNKVKQNKKSSRKLCSSAYSVSCYSYPGNLRTHQWRSRQWNWLECMTFGKARWYFIISTENFFYQKLKSVDIIIDSQKWFFNRKWSFFHLFISLSLFFFFPLILLELSHLASGYWNPLLFHWNPFTLPHKGRINFS